MSLASTTDPTMQDPGERVPVALAAPAGAVPHAAAAHNGSRLVLGVLAAVAFASLLLVIALWQKVSGMQEQLARQSADALTQSAEARTLARQASETVQAAAAKVALNETRVAELALQRSQLEELMHSLSRSRDEHLVVDIDSAVRLGLQQAQVTGNVEPLLAALKAGEQRVSRSFQPRLAPLQRALARDADRIQASSTGTTVDALHKLDDLMRLVDDLPALNAVATQTGSPLWAPEPLPADAPWWRINIRWLVPLTAGVTAGLLWTVIPDQQRTASVGERLSAPDAEAVAPAPPPAAQADAPGPDRVEQPARQEAVPAEAPQAPAEAKRADQAASAGAASPRSEAATVAKNPPVAELSARKPGPPPAAARRWGTGPRGSRTSTGRTPLLYSCGGCQSPSKTVNARSPSSTTRR